MFLSDPQVNINRSYTSRLNLSYDYTSKSHSTIVRMMIRLNVFLTIMVLGIQAAVDPVVTTVDPKHELLTEITGR